MSLIAVFLCGKLKKEGTDYDVVVGEVGPEIVFRSYTDERGFVQPVLGYDNVQIITFHNAEFDTIPYSVANPKTQSY